MIALARIYLRVYCLNRDFCGCARGAVESFDQKSLYEDTLINRMRSHFRPKSINKFVNFLNQFNS